MNQLNNDLASSMYTQPVASTSRLKPIKMSTEDVADTDTDTDTDTKLAMLASLLEPAAFPLEDLLEALQGSKGDVAKSAEVLLLPRVKSAGKRKAGTSLQSWLGKKQATSGTPQVPTSLPTPSSNGSTATSKEAIAPTYPKSISVRKPSSDKPPVDLLSVLKQPTTPEKPKNAPRPAIHLPNQSSINAYNLPLTLLQSPLSPSFASALYLTMMEESITWERNRFYLAGKWVESPHTVCHYARDPPSAPSEDERDVEVGVMDGKEGKKATYMWSGQEIATSRVGPFTNTGTLD